MSLILNIDTALDTAGASIAKDGVVLAEVFNTEQKDHGAFLQPAIKRMLKNISVTIDKLDAVAISAGPGSYTGLRVGMASAKGLCYALKKPLITIGSLEILALSAVLGTNNIFSKSMLLCPMMDARRMEVFTAIYKIGLEIVMDPCAMILDKNSFAKEMLKNQLIFFGNGAKKWEEICNAENALFIEVSGNPLAISKLAYQKFQNNAFADLAYSEPFYIKEFFNGASRP